MDSSRAGRGLQGERSSKYGALREGVEGFAGLW